MLLRLAAHLLCRALEVLIGLSALRAALFLGGVF